MNKIYLLTYIHCIIKPTPGNIIVLIMKHIKLQMSAIIYPQKITHTDREWNSLQRVNWNNWPGMELCDCS